MYQLHRQATLMKRIAIVGAGNMAEEHIKAFSSIDGVTISGIHSRNTLRAANLAKKYQIDLVSDSVASLYNQTKATGLVVAVSELSSFGVLKEAMQYDWAILAEKPITLFENELKQLRDEIANHEKQFFIALNRRFYQSTQAAKKLLTNDSEKRFVQIIDQENPLSAKKNGRPKAVTDRWMYANSIHLIDYFTMFCRGNLLETSISEIHLGSEKKIHLAHLFFSSGDIGSYTALWNLPGPWSVSISTAEKFIEMKPLESITVKCMERFYSEYESVREHRELKAGLQDQSRDFCLAIAGNQHCLVDIDEYMKTHNLIASIYKT